MQIRRVVTGHDSLGKAVFASDELVDGYHPMLNPGSAFHMLWGGDEAPHFPDDGSKPTYGSYFPAIGGFRFGTFTLPPAGSEPLADLDIPAALALDGSAPTGPPRRHAAAYLNAARPP